jgi:2-aminoadipate transaminase
MFRRIQLDESSAVPLYKQLHEQISALIRVGILPHAERIPPTRELASQLGLNRTTVSAAYGLLEADGLIRGHVGRGSFVHFEGKVQGHEPPPLISFASSQPAADEFPLADFQTCCQQVISSRDAASILQLGSPAGYLPLRRFVLNRARAEGWARATDDIIITNGCQQALDLVQRVMAPAGTCVTVEDPVYHGLKNVFDRSGTRLASVPMTPAGIDIGALARTLASERPRVLVVTPDFQNPTGATLPLEARRAIVSIAAEFGVTIVEIAIYRELRYEGESLPTLKELDTTGNVVLIGSFSKVAFPGLRVGWVIAPARVAGQLAEARQWCDLHTDHLSQAILLRFAESGLLDAHVSRVRHSGRERLQATLAACERHLPAGSEWTRPAGGLNLWVRLPHRLNAADLLPQAQGEGVTYLPGTHFAVTQRDSSALRLSFGGLTPARIEAGIATLGRLCAEQLGRAGSADRFDAVPALV